jgi:co-chaperonin GroES (HSP10)
MTPRPCNRHLIIKLIDEEVEEEKSTILLPDDFKQKPAFSCARVQSIARDCTVDVVRGDIVVFHSSMLEEVEIEGASLQMILENHIRCVL